MRLLSARTLQFVDYHFEPDSIPRYVIASHRWSRGQEATLEDVEHAQNSHKTGYKKVTALAEFVVSHIPDIDYVWIDTCCIDHRNSQEVSTAINSMFRWYARAEVCLAYLPDVTDISLEQLRQSEWWSRGWTLQELVAPSQVVFLNKDWQTIGHRGRHRSAHVDKLDLGPPLEAIISSFTGIPEDVLQDNSKLGSLPPDQKLAWAAGRKTSREEDQSYCLLGLLDVAMVANYGEGGDKARRRLLKELAEGSRDSSLTSDYNDTASSFASNVGTGVMHVTDGSAHSRSQQLLRSLHFPEIGSRRDQIKASYHGTNQWALLSQSSTDTKWDNLITWLRDSQTTSRFYWIHAKPGAGKSSLVRFLEENLEPTAHMHPWSGDSQVMMLSYYFWNPGSPLQKTLVGFMRTLLYQILEFGPDDLAKRLPNPRSSSTRSAAHRAIDPANAWTSFELRQCLWKSLSAISSNYKILILVDGLDEMSGEDDDSDDLLQFLRDLARYPNTKLCVSSRSWPIFQDEFGRYPQLRLEDLNAHDIATFIRGQLESKARFRQMLMHGNEAERLLDELMKKAAGVFLWVRLVVKDLLRAISDGDDLMSLRQKLHDIPADLNEYFGRMMHSLDLHYRSQACAILQMAIYEETEWISLPPLRLIDLVFLSQAGTDFALDESLGHFIQQAEDVNDLALTLDSTLRILSSRCKGLLECYIDRQSKLTPDHVVGEVVSKLSDSFVETQKVHKDVMFDLRIDFMHRSLREYLMQPEQQMFLHLQTDGPFDVANYLRNARLCQIFLCMHWQFRDTSVASLISHFISSISTPALRSSARGAQLARRLEPALEFVVSCAEYVEDYFYIADTFEAWTYEQSNFLTLAIDFAWTRYLEETLTSEAVRGKQGRPILDYALRPRLAWRYHGDVVAIGYQYPDSQLVERILALGADPNALYDGISIWVNFLEDVATYGRTTHGKGGGIRATAMIQTLGIMIHGGAALSFTTRELKRAHHKTADPWPALAEQNFREDDVVPITALIEYVGSLFGDVVGPVRELAARAVALNSDMRP